LSRPRRSASRDRKALRAELDVKLRALLRETRLRPEVPTLDDAQDEEDAIKDCEASLLRWEAVLHDSPPDEDAAKDFEYLLGLFWKPVIDLGKKLSQIGEADELPEGWEKAVRSLLDVVYGYQELLFSFEELLHAFPPPAPEKLVDSFEDLLHDACRMIVRLALVVGRQPSKRLVERFCRRVEAQGALVASAEALMKQFDPPSRAFAKSLLLLVSEYQRLVSSAKDLIEKVPDNRRLLTRLENMLHRDLGLGESAADVIDPHLPDAQLAIDFEDYLSLLESILDRFETIVKNRKPPDRFLARSFENLLRELGHLLGRLETMVEAGPDHKQIKNLERRLEIYADLLESFQTIAATLTQEPFVRSFQDLLRGLRKLIRRFAKLVKDDPGNDDEKKESKDSLAGLRARFKELLASLEELKDKLPSVPPGMQEDNEALLAGMQELDGEYFALLEPAPDELYEYLAALADGYRILSRFALLFGRRRRRRPSAEAVRRYRALVARQAELVADARRLVARVEIPSPRIAEALEDLDALQKRLDARAGDLAALERT
jgi:hypothetical protein